MREDWTIIVPMAVMEYCSAMGMPIRICVFNRCPEGRQSSRDIRSTGTHFTM